MPATATRSTASLRALICELGRGGGAESALLHKRGAFGGISSGVMLDVSGFYGLWSIRQFLNFFTLAQLGRKWLGVQTCEESS